MRITNKTNMATANQLYKEYKKKGGEDSFKEWMSREKKNSFLNYDGQVPENKALTDSVNQTLNNLYAVQPGYQDKPDNTHFLGLNKTYLVIGASIVVLGLAAWVIYNKHYTNKN